MVPAVTTLLGWPNYGPYGTYPQAQLYWLLLGWPNCEVDGRSNKILPAVQ